MKAVHSYKSDKVLPYLESVGGASIIKPAIQIMALSACTIRKHFDDFTLITDDAGKAMAEACAMPYSEIISVGPSFGSDPCFWIHSKLHAYNTIQEPFVHFDTDLLLWDSLPAEYLANEVFAFHSETYAWASYVKYHRDLVAAGFTVPALDATYWTSRMPINMAIFGGNDYKTINQYAGFVLEFLADNNGFLNTTPEQQHVVDASISLIEQAWASYLIQDAHRIPISLLLTEEQVLNNLQVPGIKLTHLHGAKQAAQRAGKLSDLMLRLAAKLQAQDQTVYSAVDKFTTSEIDIAEMIKEAAANDQNLTQQAT